KGHDFQRVTLVGVVAADMALGRPDFRAAEKTFQLLTQVAGRAGRGELSGEVLVETYYPEHYAIQFAARQDYASFYEKEAHFRRMLHYPPFTALARVRNDFRFQFVLKSPNRAALGKALQSALDFCDAKQIPETSVLIDVDPT